MCHPDRQPVLTEEEWVYVPGITLEELREYRRRELRTSASLNDKTVKIKIDRELRYIATIQTVFNSSMGYRHILTRRVPALGIDVKC